MRSHRKILAGIAFNLNQVGQKIVDLLNPLTDKAATIYDKAVDAAYNATRIGGAFHRLIDGSHDLVGMAKAVHNASPSDTLLQEIEGYITAAWKDLATVQGLPILSLSRETFEKLVSLGAAVGLSRGYIYDVLTTNAAEVVAATLTFLGVRDGNGLKDGGKLVGLHLAAGNPVGVALGTGLAVKQAIQSGLNRAGVSDFVVDGAKGAALQTVVTAVATKLGAVAAVAFLLALAIVMDNLKRLSQNQLVALIRDMLAEKLRDAACFAPSLPARLAEELRTWQAYIDRRRKGSCQTRATRRWHWRLSGR